MIQNILDLTLSPTQKMKKIYVKEATNYTFFPLFSNIVH